MNGMLGECHIMSHQSIRQLNQYQQIFLVILHKPLACDREMAVGPISRIKTSVSLETITVSHSDKTPCNTSRESASL